MAHWNIQIEFDENDTIENQTLQAIESAARISHINLPKTAATAIIKQITKLNK